MSQQQINYRSLDKHLFSAQKKLKKQADNYYTEKHFKIGNNFDRYKFLHAQMYIDILCTEDCEITRWLDKKERGALDERIKIKPLIKTKDDGLEIHNHYYNTPQTWTEAEW